MTTQQRLNQLSSKVCGNTLTSSIVVTQCRDILESINNQLTPQELNTLYTILCDLYSHRIYNNSNIDHCNEYVMLLNYISKYNHFTLCQISQLIDKLKYIRFDCDITFVEEYKKKGYKFIASDIFSIFAINSKNFDKLCDKKLKQNEFQTLCHSKNFVAFINNDPNILSNVLSKSPDVQISVGYMNRIMNVSYNKIADLNILISFIPTIYKQNRDRTYHFIYELFSYNEDCSYNENKCCSYIENECRENKLNQLDKLNRLYVIIDKFIDCGMEKNQIFELLVLMHYSQRPMFELYKKYNLQLTENEMWRAIVALLANNFGLLKNDLIEIFYNEFCKCVNLKKIERLALSMITICDHDVDLSLHSFDPSNLDYGLLNACIIKNFDLIVHYLDKKVIVTKNHVYAFLIENNSPQKFNPIEILSVFVSYGFNYDYECCELIMNRFGIKPIEELYNSKKITLSENQYNALRQLFNSTLFKLKSDPEKYRSNCDNLNINDSNEKKIKILQKKCSESMTSTILYYMLSTKISFDRICCENIIVSNSIEVFYYFYDDIMKTLSNKIPLDMILKINDYVKRKIFIKMFYPNIDLGCDVPNNIITFDNKNSLNENESPDDNKNESSDDEVVPIKNIPKSKGKQKKIIKRK